MSLATLGLCFCLSIGAQPAPDRWFAEDKLKHFVASFVITSMAASAARAGGAEPVRSAWIGAGVGASVGVWKEIRDSRHPGHSASVRDLVWDLAGVGTAVAFMRHAR